MYLLVDHVVGEPPVAALGDLLELLHDQLPSRQDNLRENTDNKMRDISISYRFPHSLTHQLTF